MYLLKGRKENNEQQLLQQQQQQQQQQQAHSPSRSSGFVTKQKDALSPRNGNSNGNEEGTMNAHTNIALGGLQISPQQSGNGNGNNASSNNNNSNSNNISSSSGSGVVNSNGESISSGNFVTRSVRSLSLTKSKPIKTPATGSSSSSSSSTSAGVGGAQGANPLSSSPSSSASALLSNVIASPSSSTSNQQSKQLLTKSESMNGPELTDPRVPSKKGYLRKENRRGRYQQRYMITNNAYLNYYRRRRGSKKLPALASIDLRQAMTICVLVRHGRPSSKFAIQTKIVDSDTGVPEEECFFLKASNEAEAREWVNVLNARRKWWLGDRTGYEIEEDTIPPTISNGNQAGNDDDGWQEDDEDMNDEDDNSKTRKGDGKKGNEKGLDKRGKKSSSSGNDKTIASTASSSKAPPLTGNSSVTVTSTAGAKSQKSSNVVTYEAEDDDDDDGFVTSQEMESDEDAEEILSPETDSEDNDESAATDTEKPSPGIMVLMRNAQVKNNGVNLNLRKSIARYPRPFVRKSWMEPGVSELRVRGASYLEDGLKVAANEPLFHIVAVDLFDTTKQGRVDNIASHPKNRVALAKANGENHNLFVLNFQVPGPPIYSCVLYLIPRDAQVAALMEHALTGKAVDTQYLKKPTEFPPGFFSLFDSFFAGSDDKFRDERFKLVPRIVEGPWVVRQAVGSKPACIGTKLKQRYFRHPNYFELDIDIGASVIAWQATKIAANKAKLLTIDLALVLQGNSKEELPEETFGIVRVHQLDFRDAVLLDD